MNNNPDLEQIRKSNREFRQLEEEHHRLERELSDILRRKVLTPAEELEKKRLQKKKLMAKDRMMEILREPDQSSGARTEIARRKR
jgi:uncharacterized protein YdcH (DUF465 family)